MAGGSCHDGLFAVHVGAVPICYNLNKVAVVGGVDVVEHDIRAIAEYEQDIAVTVIAELIVIDDPGVAGTALNRVAQQVLAEPIIFIIVVFVAVTCIANIEAI